LWLFADTPRLSGCIGKSSATIGCSAVLRLAARTGTESPSMECESKKDRFLKEAEECLRMVDLALNLADKKAWMQLAEDWMKLARSVRE
jgi:hypothetical protein